MGGGLGRLRFVLLPVISELFRIVFSSPQIDESRKVRLTLKGLRYRLCGHGFGAAGRKKELGLSKRLHLFDGGVGSEFAEEQAVPSDVDDSEFRDDVVDDF